MTWTVYTQNNSVFVTGFFQLYCAAGGKPGTTRPTSRPGGRQPVRPSVGPFPRPPVRPSARPPPGHSKFFGLQLCVLLINIVHDKCFLQNSENKVDPNMVLTLHKCDLTSAVDYFNYNNSLDLISCHIIVSFAPDAFSTPVDATSVHVIDNGLKSHYAYCI